MQIQRMIQKILMIKLRHYDHVYLNLIDDCWLPFPNRSAIKERKGINKLEFALACQFWTF